MSTGISKPPIFGCGEAKLAEAVSDRHTVYSFDHLAISNDVIACDMAHVPLDDETLDVAIFSLCLMGTNFTDYLGEAYRTLKPDGQLHILEPTSRFTNRDQFILLKAKSLPGEDSAARRFAERREPTQRRDTPDLDRIKSAEDTAVSGPLVTRRQPTRIGAGTRLMIPVASRQ